MPAPKNAPLYQQIYDEIKDAIEKGVYAPKERIPSELELAEQYDVSRITVRRAVEELCSDGYLVKQQGRGTFVSTPHINRQFHASTLQTFTALCADNDMKAGAHVVDRQIVPARQNEMEFFGLQKDALLLSSGEGIRKIMNPVFKTQCGDNIIDISFIHFFPVKPQRKNDIFPHIDGGYQIECLKYKSDLSSPENGKLILLHGIQVLSLIHI